MIDTTSLQPYINLLPHAVTAFVITLLLTPLIGNLAKKFHFVDLPASMRKRTDSSNNTRLHEGIKPRLGGLAVLLPFIILTFLNVELNLANLGILTGLGILLISGVIDDRFELSAGRQLLIQLMVAILVVITGTTITNIDFAGQSFNFVSSSNPIFIGNFTYMFRFPADLITIFWILAITNALNWVSGIDALGETTTFIASTITMMLAVRAGQFGLAILPAILSGGLLGFMPYNFPPAKIFSGTAGSTGYGFIIAVLAILSGSKITTSILVLSLPIVDMLWVILYRIKTHQDLPLLKRPFVGGNVHLHHRLMSLGLSAKQTLALESITMGIIALFAFYIGGFSTHFIVLIGIIFIIFIAFLLLSYRLKKNGDNNQTVKKKPDEPPKPDTSSTPEEKYAY